MHYQNCSSLVALQVTLMVSDFDPAAAFSIKLSQLEAYGTAMKPICTKHNFLLASCLSSHQLGLAQAREGLCSEASALPACMSQTPSSASAQHHPHLCLQVCCINHAVGHVIVPVVVCESDLVVH